MTSYHRRRVAAEMDDPEFRSEYEQARREGESHMNDEQQPTLAELEWDRRIFEDVVRRQAARCAPLVEAVRAWKAARERCELNADDGSDDIEAWKAELWAAGNALDASEEALFAALAELEGEGQE